MLAAANPRWQFTLRRALIAVALLNALFGAIFWAGLLGAVLFGGTCGLSLSLLGWLRGDARYLIPGLLLSLVAGAVLLAGGSVAIGDGRSMQPCTIEVVDQASGEPISDAIVYLRDVQAFDWPEGLPVQSIPANETYEWSLANTAGTARLTWEFPFSERSGMFVNKAHIYIRPEFWIQVDASGYEARLVQMNSLTGSTYDYFKLPLPKMKISLQRRETGCNADCVIQSSCDRLQ